MVVITLVFVFILLMMIGVPVVFSMGATSLLAGVFFWGVDAIPLATFAQRMLSGMNSFTMLSVPLFLLAGRLMNEGEITNKLFNFAQKTVGHLPGGLGHVNILCSVIFAGMSGTSVADAAGLGTIEIKAMTDNGFDKEFSIGITGGSALIGPIIPPSVPMVLYGAIAECSISSLFIGGVAPGVLMALGMAAMVTYYAIKRNYPRERKATGKELWEALKESFLPLMTPVIIVGGIWSGVFTATEASGMAVLYATILILFIYKNMTLKQLWGHLKATAIDCACIMFVMAGCSLYGYVLTRSRIPQIVAEALTNLTRNPTLIVLIIVVFLMFIGCFMSTTESILLFAPIFVPVIRDVHYNVVAFGVVMCLALCIGQLTPPFGSSLFVLSKTTGVRLDRVAKACFPFLIPVVLITFLCAIVPEVVTLLPNLAF